MFPDHHNRRSAWSLLPLLAIVLAVVAMPTTARALSAPTPLQPSATTYDPTPLFHWTHVVGADRYRLAVKDTSGNWVYLPEPTPTGIFHTGSTLTRGQCYTWEVRAETNLGIAGPWSSPKSFCVGTLGTPSPSGPTGYTFDRTPTFSWSAVPGANHYRLAVKDSGGNWVYLPEPLPTSTSYTHGSALGIGCFTWNVRAEYAIGDFGPWSPTRSFCTANVPAKPTADSPKGTIADDTPLFLWLFGSGANYYRLQVFVGITTQLAISPEPTPTVSNYLVPTADRLSDGQCYSWRVRGELDANAVGPWSDLASFCVDLAPLRSAPLGPTGSAGVVPVWELDTIGGEPTSRLGAASISRLARFDGATLVVRPGRLPAAATVSLGRDAEGRERRTLALLGADVDEASFDRSSGDPRVDLGARWPAIFRVERADGTPLADADLYPTAEHGYRMLRVTGAEPGSFEAFARERFKGYLRAILDASLDGSQSRVTAWRVEIPSIDKAAVHPEIHARYVREMAMILDELAAEQPWLDFGRVIQLVADDAPRGAGEALPTR